MSTSARASVGERTINRRGEFRDRLLQEKSMFTFVMKSIVSFVFLHYFGAVSLKPSRTYNFKVVYHFVILSITARESAMLQNFMNEACLHSY